MRRIIVPIVAVIGLAIPFTPEISGANSSDAERPVVVTATGDDPMVAEINQLLDEVFIKNWNEKKIEELVAGFYTEDAVVMPPNQEPITGRAGIVAFYTAARELVGEFNPGDNHLIQARVSGNTVSLLGQYDFRSGKIRLVTHELFERQSDGSIKSAVEMIGYRDPGK